MLSNLIITFANRSPEFRGRMFKWTFNTLARMTPHLDSWTLINYGYADTDGHEQRLALDAADEAERYCLQLYRHAIGQVELRERDVVEVSCGRGGGAAFVRRYLGARSVTGVDLSAQQIDFCRRIHRLPGLHFVQGAAEDIPLPDQCADAVVNIEASCLYQDTAKFFAEVARLLRPGGRFLYADVHRAQDIDRLDAELSGSGLRVMARQDISGNVLRALELDHERRVAVVRAHAPFFLRGLLKVFVGALGTRIPNGLADGSLVYLSFILAKPGEAVGVGNQAPVRVSAAA